MPDHDPSNNHTELPEEFTDHDNLPEQNNNAKKVPEVDLEDLSQHPLDHIIPN